MKTEYNRQIIDKRAKNWQESLTKLLEFLANEDDPELYNDVHIYPEEGYIMVEWVQIPYSHEWGGGFQYVDYDQRIMTEKFFPDHSSMLVEHERDWVEALDQWMKDNPEEAKRYEVNEHGDWYVNLF